MTTRNLRRMYFVCVWATYAVPALAVLGALCGALRGWRNWPAWPAAALIAGQLLAFALGQLAYRVLRRKGEYPW